MRGIGEGKENLSEEGGNTPTVLRPLPNLPARLAPTPSSPKTLVFIDPSWRFCLLKKKAPFPYKHGKGAFYWLGLYFELYTAQSVLLKGEPAPYFSTLPKRGKARNRDSIRSKVLGRGGMGVRGKGGETFLQKGFPSLPQTSSPTSKTSNVIESLMKDGFYGWKRGACRFCLKRQECIYTFALPGDESLRTDTARFPLP